MALDGGPAFPTGGEYVASGDRAVRKPDAPGMSLRDYFAGQALIGTLLVAAKQGNIVLATQTVHGGDQIIARRAYEVADAMLAEREKS